MKKDQLAADPVESPYVLEGAHYRRVAMSFSRDNDAIIRSACRGQTGGVSARVWRKSAAHRFYSICRKCVAGMAKAIGDKS